MTKCKVCIRVFTAELSVIKKHVLTKKHITSIRTIGTKQTPINNFIIDDAKLKLADQTKQAELLLCGFLSEHNLAFNVTDHLAKICKKAFPDSKVALNLTLGRTKSKAVVKNIIGKCTSEEIANKLKTSLFSIIIDESTDIGCVKTMCICVKYFDSISNTFETNFFKLVQLFENSESANIGATAEKIFNEVVKAFTDDDIPLKNMIGNKLII